MASWSRGYAPAAATSEPQEEKEELLVFGYSCKLFRDDEKARYLDRGGHLIPWMGDSSLLIDRYDGRGHLFDLKPYDSDGVARQGWSTLTEDQQRLEALIDEERYLELHTDIVEKAMYEEEEVKRLNEALQENLYGAVGFNYNYQAAPEDNSQSAEVEEELGEEEQESFVIPPGLQIPDGMHMPPNLKVNAIIEKTAKFVALQGQQMEIVIKMKQKDNAQFDFLNFSHYLNPYYKHVVRMIKTGKYKPQEHVPKPKPAHDYLHPSLAPQTKSDYVAPEISSKKFLESVKSKLPAGQLEGSAYAALVQKLSKHTAGRNSPDITTLQQPPKPPEPPVSSYGPPPPPGPPPGPPQGPPGLDMEQGQMYGPSMPPPPGMEPVILPSHQQPPPPGTVPPEPPPPPAPQVDHQLPEEQPLLPGVPPIITPPPDVQPIIDKMAAYVAKNGPDFEIVVKSKNDPRFEFLQTWHEYYEYYEFKRSMFEKEYEEARPPTTQPDSKSEESPDTSSKQTKFSSTSPKAQLQPKAVCFSIKPKETETPTRSSSRSRSALLGDSSDEEGENGRRQQQETDTSQSAGEVDGEPLEGNTETPTKDPRPEKPSLTPEEIEKRERREAEDQLKDRLATAAREKLVQVKKESQLKAERKKKAAMFLKLLKTTGPAVKLDDEGSNQGSSIGETLSPLASPIASATNSPRRGHTPSTSKSRSKTNSPGRPYSPLRSNSPVHRSTVSRSRSPSRSRACSGTRSRSRSRSKSRRRSRSPRRRDRKRAKTPPSAYSIIRRSKSRSPVRPREPKPRLPIAFRSKRSRSRSKSPIHKYRKYERSRSRSPSKSKSKKRSKSRSPPRTHKSHKSHKSKEEKKSKDEKKDKKEKKEKSHKSSRKSRSRSKDRTKEDKNSKSSKSPKKKKKKDKRNSRSRSPSKRESRSPGVTEEKQKSSSPEESQSNKSEETKNQGPDLYANDGPGKNGASDVPEPPSVPASQPEQDNNYESSDDDVIIVEKKAVDKDILSKVRKMLQATKIPGPNEEVHVDEIL